MNPRSCVACMSVSGSILVLLGAVFLGCFPLLYNSILKQVMIVSEDSLSYEAFLSPPVPIYMQFFFFNVTNPKEIRFDGAKPNLTTVGPYTYLEVRQKYNLTFNATDGTVEYLDNKQYFFEESLSKGHKETDRITTINAVMVSLGSKIGELPPALKALVEMIFLRFDEELFITRSVEELTFKGYEEPLLAHITKLTGEAAENKGRFGFFYPKNDTSDKTYRVKTGELGFDDFQQITGWNGKPTLNFWHDIIQDNSEDLDQYCNMINGTDGSMYGPGVTRDDTLYIYDSMLCRSMYLKYEKDLEFHGLPVIRFIPPEDMLQDPEINNDNLCYCYPERSNCLGAGFLNMAPCAAGAPVIMSTPHFYQGDEDELNKLIGLNPIKEDHETILDVEPKTGITMRAAKRIQVNVPLRQYGNLPSFKNVPEVIFPILFVNESVELSKEDIELLIKGLTLPFTIVDAVSGVLVGIGGILLLSAALKCFRIKVQVKNSKENGDIKVHHYSASSPNGGRLISKQKTNNYSTEKTKYKIIPINDS